jgi:tetratricopeptide (TPR) repeat protein
MPACFRTLFLALCVSALLFPAVVRAQSIATTNAPASVPPTPKQAANKLIADAARAMAANNADGALNDLSQSIKLNPNNEDAYIYRASIYCQKKQWTQAEDDFKAAAKIAPTNIVIKFNLVEIKFMQKQYDAARPGFVALEGDPDMGDFASYKVFLCDLFGGHEAAAKKELDVFNDAMGNPSYYFSNAAWDLYHKNIDDARSWLLSASHIYPVNKFTTYGQSLRELGYLPIPEPKQQ